MPDSSPDLWQTFLSKLFFLSGQWKIKQDGLICSGHSRDSTGLLCHPSQAPKFWAGHSHVPSAHKHCLQSLCLLSRVLCHYQPKPSSHLQSELPSKVGQVFQNIIPGQSPGRLNIDVNAEACHKAITHSYTILAINFAIFSFSPSINIWTIMICWIHLKNAQGLGITYAYLHDDLHSNVLLQIWWEGDEENESASLAKGAAF